jgi:amino acid transporter
MFEKFKRALLGAPRKIDDPDTFHKISLIAVLAWVGLGADGLSSSAYGPDEAFRALGQHAYLAIGLALATSITVFVISSAYRGIIEHFPYGGGGYIVATQLLGPGFGVVSGSALLVDYILTVSVSIACCADQLFSVLPPALHHYKLAVEAFIIGLMVMMNLRGVKESILVLTPIFVMFIVMHVILICGGVGMHLGALPRVTSDLHAGFKSGLATLGVMGMLALFLRAFSMGAGTFTGLEAVSNGLQIMREPKVQTGKRTMTYMAISLALTASGILLCYLLFRVSPEPGKTMNAVLLERFVEGWRLGTLPIGHGFVVLTLATEAALLFVGAQTGFIDGPRVMANMALDGWLPRRYSQLSDRLTMQNGVFLMGGAALATLFYTRGDITALVTMYSINVFLTFSLSMTGMTRFYLRQRRAGKPWARGFLPQVIGLCLCASILVTVVIEKFAQGAWMTLVITIALIALCWTIRRHYREVGGNIRRLDAIFEDLPTDGEPMNAPVDPRQHTAVMLVGGYSGLGVHQLLQVQRLFPGQFRNFLFVSVAVVDSAAMKGIDEVERVRERAAEGLAKYVALARRLGFAADWRMAMGADAMTESERMCKEIRREFPRAIFFLGKLIFEREAWYHRFLHNQTAYQLQQRLHMAGLDAIILTVRLLDKGSPSAAAPPPAPQTSDAKAP